MLTSVKHDAAGAGIFCLDFCSMSSHSHSCCGPCSKAPSSEPGASGKPWTMVACRNGSQGKRETWDKHRRAVGRKKGRAGDVPRRSTCIRRRPQGLRGPDTGQSPGQHSRGVRGVPPSLGKEGQLLSGAAEVGVELGLTSGAGAKLPSEFLPSGPCSGLVTRETTTQA